MLSQFSSGYVRLGQVRSGYVRLVHVIQAKIE
jgi:hypothetical protein